MMMTMMMSMMMDAHDNHNDDGHDDSDDTSGNRIWQNDVEVCLYSLMIMVLWLCSHQNPDLTLCAESSSKPLAQQRTFLKVARMP